MEHEDEKEKVLVRVRHHKDIQETQEEETKEEPREEKSWQIPRRWRVY